MTGINSFRDRNRQNINSYGIDGQNAHIKKNSKKEDNKPSGQPEKPSLSVLGSGLPKMLRG